MSKNAEIDYVRNVAVVENVDPAAYQNYLQRKPFSDPLAPRYLNDIAQILTFLPPPPARILDLGAGSGWTSEMFAWRGYDVTGLDICPDMIEIANRKLAPTLPLRFDVYDYESPLPGQDVDAVVMYDALHHAVDELLALQRAYAALRENGVFICIEPGRGHSQTEDTRAAVRKYGVTEKDMPFVHVRPMLEQVGFRSVEHYARLAGLPIFDLAGPNGEAQQLDGMAALLRNTTQEGLSSVIVARR